MKTAKYAILWVSLGLLNSATAAIEVKGVGPASGYAETDMNAFRSADVEKGFDSDGDNIYGSEGLFFIGDGRPGYIADKAFNNFTKVGADWAVVSAGADATAYHTPAKEWNYADIDDPSVPPSADVPDWSIQSGWVRKSGAGTKGDWEELFRFSIDETAPNKFRVGIMAAHADHAGFHPAGLRLAEAGGATASVVGLDVRRARLAGMVFFDVNLNGETSGSFSILVQRQSDKNGCGIAGITFDDFQMHPDAAAAKLKAEKRKMLRRLKALREQGVSLDKAVSDLTDSFPGRYPSKYQDVPDAFESLDALVAKVKAGDEAALAEAGEMLDELEELRREALLANPLLRDVSLLYTTRRQYKRDHHNTATLFQKGEINEQKFDPPGKIKILNMKTGETDILVDAGKTGITRDPELSHDGSKVIFSMRKSVDDDYHIYEVDIDGSNLKQLTSMPGVSDIDPVYLPDGKIIFSSTREPKFCMCNRHIMANLYRMDGDGANIHQIGKSTLFEGHSTVMEDGRILYDRWEYTDRNFGDAQGLWVVNPDGTLHAIFYGNNTRSPGGVIDARQIPGSQNVVCIFGSCHDRPWGALAVLDRNKGVDGAAPVEHIWPASARELIGKGNFDTFTKVRPRYEDPFPLAEPGTDVGAGKYFLCVRTIEDNDERMGIYLIDTFGNEVLVHEEPDGFGCFDPMPILSREKENAKPDQRDFENKNGTFYVQDVYEGTHMEGVGRGEVKYLRVVETPEKRSWIRERWGGQGAQAPAMNWHSFENKRILGTVPVEEDGSAYFEVPSDTFFYFQLLDKDGKMIQSMRSGTIIQSGEMQGCVGCHEDRVETPPASAVGLQALARPPSQMGTGYGAGQLFSYQSEVQPVFDKHCVKCHDFGKKAADELLLAGDKSLVFNASYIDLHRRKAVTVAGGGQAEIYPAKTWGSHASKLTRALNGHGKARLTSQEKLRVYTWMDLNGIYYPTYDCAYPENPAGRSPITTKQLERLAELCGLETKPMLSHRANPGALISFDRPEKSPCLSELDKASEEYREALAIIDQGAENLNKTARADMPRFEPSAGDLQRTERYEVMRGKEDAFRAALREGRKLYDSDL